MKKIKLARILITFIPLLFLSFPLFVFAQGSGGDANTSPSGNGGNVVKIANPLVNGISTLPQLITAILNNVVMPVATVFIVLMIIYSGFKYITAQGKPAAIAEANKGLMYVLIGAAILLGAAGISAAVSGTICNNLIAC